MLAASGGSELFAAYTFLLCIARVTGGFVVVRAVVQLHQSTAVSSVGRPAQCM